MAALLLGFITYIQSDSFHIKHYQFYVFSFRQSYIQLTLHMLEKSSIEELMYDKTPEHM